MEIDYNILPGEKLEKVQYKNKEEPIISIITPHHNGEKYIEQTAKSVLNQTFPYFEWIIVDDNSSKKSQQKLKQIEKMDSRIKIFYREKTEPASNYPDKDRTGAKLLGTKLPGGPAAARDYGINKSAESSRYIVFLDADDLYSNTFLECCYWTLETHKEASWTYTDSINFGARNFLWRKWYNVEWEKEENILTVCACIRKEDLLEVGCFGITEKKVYEDWYLWLKLIKKGKYPIRMSSLLTWYRQKEEMGELKKSNETNRKNAMNIINREKRDIVYYKEGIQFPKFDYDWAKIKEKNKDIIVPKKIDENKTNIKNNRNLNKRELNKINILMIIPWMVTGGADRFNLNLISKMDKEKFDFTIITTLPSKNEWKNKFERYAKIYDLTSFLEMKDWLSFINYIIEKNEINLIFNSNNEYGYKIIPYLKSKYPEIPIIDYVHMEEWYWKNGGYSRDSSVLKKVIDKTYTCNENSKKVFVKYFKRDKEEIQTAYVGVDEKKFDPKKFNKEEILEEIKTKYNIKNIENKKVISYICRIAEQKRPYLFFEVIKELQKVRNDFIVLIAGDGPILEGLKQKVKQNNMEDTIYFLGNQSETEKIYKISDITINTSIKEGLALTAYESLAMGVPVISSDTGGQKELITEDVGIIVPLLQKEKDILNFEYSKKEILNYIKAINKVLNNLEYYKANCRNKILNGFTVDNMIKRMEEDFIQIARYPNQEKIESGKNLSKNKEILIELISTYLMSSKQEYEYLADKFNTENVHIARVYDKKAKKKLYYEHTLEYKLKHPIVVALRKIGVYSQVRKVLRMD